MRHKIKHHVSRPVLHLGLFTDRQMLPASVAVTAAAGWLYAGVGAVPARLVIALFFLAPIAVMAADNRAGGMVVDWFQAQLRWRRDGGVFAPGVPSDIGGYSLSVDERDEIVLERERLLKVDLETVFAHE